MRTSGMDREKTLDRLLQLQRKVSSFQEWRQLEAVWLRERLGLSGLVTAEALNYRPQTVHLLWSHWLHRGLAMFEQRQAPGGRRHAYLSLEEEAAILASFRQQAEAGGLVTAAAVQAALSQRVGRPVASSTVYRLLKRHGWRKIAPRKRHPKAIIEDQEGIKKTDPGSHRRG